MTEQTPPDTRPEPKYGQYAPITAAAPDPQPTVATPAVAPSPPPAAATRRRTRDIVITTALLLLGVYDVVTGFSGFASLGSTLAQVYEVQGIPGFASQDLANRVGAAINIGKVALLAVTIVVSLLLIARHRLAFWVPLAAGVLSALALVACVTAVLLNDPAFLAWAETQSP